MKSTCLEKYGVDHVFKADEIKDKISETHLERRGVDHISKCDEIKEKKLSNCLEKYGVENVLLIPDRIGEYQEKQKLTNLLVYGYENAMQNEEVFYRSCKSGFRLKEYILPSGTPVMLQGYEPQILDILLKTYKEFDIIINDIEMKSKIGAIHYFLNNTKHRYFPDIYIIPENKIIEVKSKYTYEKDLEKNIAKRDVCLEMGFAFEFMIWDARKKSVSIKF